MGQFLPDPQPQFVHLLHNNCTNLNVIVKGDNNIYLYNSRYAKIPGRNPIKFNNLDEYVEFVEKRLEITNYRHPKLSSNDHEKNQNQGTSSDYLD